VLALDAKRDVDARIRIKRCQKEADHLVADVVSKLAFVRLFPLGHKLVYCASKSVYDCAL
jgi:hypothetical protein